MEYRCKRTFFSNKRGQIFEADRFYDIDPKDQKMARFFDVPEDPATGAPKPVAVKK